MQNSAKPAICVDLDNTLLLGDTLHEAIITLLKQNPLLLFCLLFWGLHGKAYFKTKLAEQVALNPEHLQYNQHVLNWVKAKHQTGHPVYLVTGAPQAFADAVANYVGLFTKVFATTPKINLTGQHKADRCQRYFGKQGFIYLGDCKKDLAVWNKSLAIVYTGHDSKLIAQCKQLNKPIEILPKQKPTVKTFLKAMRIHQYSKNSLLFFPLLLNSAIAPPPLIQQTLLAFIVFCTTCSAVYIINDLYDLPADRQHQTKCKRPFASGQLSLPIGFILVVGCLSLSVTLQSVIQNTLFSLVVSAYFIISLSYSQWLKKIAILDVMVLTVLYTIRIVAGMVLLSDPLSHWFLTFSIFFFLSLSYLKRYIELSQLANKKSALPRRGYQHHHEMFVKINGLATGCGSIIIFLLYISSSRALHIYNTPSYLYLVAFGLFYWIQRIWLLAVSSKVHADPVVFALKDKESYFVGVMSLIAILLAHTGT